MTDALPDAPQVLLAHHLKALKLPTFLREHDKLARQCASEGADHVRYLLRLAELEALRELARNGNARVYMGLGDGVLKIGDTDIRRE